VKLLRDKQTNTGKITNLLGGINKINNVVTVNICEEVKSFTMFL